MSDAVSVQCPWCGERVELSIDPDTSGNMIEDCEVCCHPWQISIDRDEDGELSIHVERGN